MKINQEKKLLNLHADSKVLQLRVTLSPLKPINWAFKYASFWIIISGGQQLEVKEQKCAFLSRCAVTNDVQAEGFTSYEAAFTSIAQSSGVPPAHEWRGKKILKNNRLEVGPKFSVQLKEWIKKKKKTLGNFKILKMRNCHHLKAFGVVNMCVCLCEYFFLLLEWNCRPGCNFLHQFVKNGPMMDNLWVTSDLWQAVERLEWQPSFFFPPKKRKRMEEGQPELRWGHFRGNSPSCPAAGPRSLTVTPWWWTVAWWWTAGLHLRWGGWVGGRGEKGEAKTAADSNFLPHWIERSVFGSGTQLFFVRLLFW